MDPNVEDGQERTSPYGYVFDDPIKLIDPDGRAPENGPGPKAIIVAGLAVAGGTVAVAAPTVVGEAIAVPVAVVEVTGAALIAGGVGLYGIISNALHNSESTEPEPAPQSTPKKPPRGSNNEKTKSAAQTG